MIFFPYVVLCELDGLKKNSDGIGRLAQKAIKFIRTILKENGYFVHGQSATEDGSQSIPIKCADDRIINCCLQISEKKRKLILLTEDINLRNKANFNDFGSFSEREIREKCNERNAFRFEQ